MIMVINYVSHISLHKKECHNGGIPMPGSRQIVSPLLSGMSGQIMILAGGVKVAIHSIHIVMETLENKHIGIRPLI